MKLEEIAGLLLREAGLTLAVAESCTGGLLGALITAVPGSSAYFLGGVICYSDSVKTGLLGVSPRVISEHGAVSAECALDMAQGALQATGATIALSITGIAGPDGGTQAKPAGTTYIALVGQDTEEVARFNWHGDRVSNREQSANMALEMLVRYLEASTADK